MSAAHPIGEPTEGTERCTVLYQGVYHTAGERATPCSQPVDDRYQVITQLRHRVLVTGPKGADGKYPRRSWTVDGTRRDAEREERRLKAEIEAQHLAFVEPTRDTVAQFLAAWLDQKAREVRPKTMEGYRLAVEFRTFGLSTGRGQGMSEHPAGCQVSDCA